MKPLLSVICYNRKDLTLRTLHGLQEMGAFEQAEVVIWDNASADGTFEMLQGMAYLGQLDGERIWSHLENIGCPQALNWILACWRKPGQHFIKVDNDVVLQTLGWVDTLCTFFDAHPDVVLAGPWYEELLTANQGRIVADHGDWLEVFPIIGHCVAHRGAFLDQAGFFDVLADDHLYGFEDNLMAHRAGAAGYKCAVLKTVTLQNIQRHSSLDHETHTSERREAHVCRLRPEYERRVHLVHKYGASYHVNERGQIEL